MRTNRILTTVSVVLFACLGAHSQQVRADQISLQVGATHPTMLAGEKETNHVRISLTGFELPESKSRPPVNVSIVIDTSGSMSGQKIRQARDAAIAAVNRLKKDDIVSVVLYNSSSQVLVPATKATDRQDVIAKIKTIKAGGSTALFAGVSKGAAEVRKFLDEEMVNRVILLSDGRANVGPKSPGELERLGASLVKEGISVSTLGLGLGYNEDLMSRLASSASGNHIFVEEADDLVAVFNAEFNDLMSVVAGDFEIHARAAAGVRPVRVLGTKADISGQDIYIPLAQLYSRQQRYFVIEVEVDAGEAEETRPLMSVSVKYRNLITETTDKLSSSVDVRFSDEVSTVKKEIDHETYAFCSIQLANERNVRATALRDAGQIEAAQELLNLNVRLLNDTAEACESNGVLIVVPELKKNVVLNQVQSVEISKPADWVRLRKGMRQAQSDNTSQRTYKVPSKTQK
ncbi:MAG: VWA domain-containing protein [Pirellulaceae bacterium]|nr:VWA domain-containing protein [Pirellulaceae bacterium]